MHFFSRQQMSKSPIMCDDSLDYDLKTFVSQTMHYNVTYLAVFLRIKYDQAGYP